MSADMTRWSALPRLTMRSLYPEPETYHFADGHPAVTVRPYAGPPVVRVTEHRVEHVIDVSRLRPGEAVTFARPAEGEERDGRYLTMTVTAAPEREEWE